MRTKTLKNTLVLLLAALALTFFAACSSESDPDPDPDPAYCGTWTPTDALITYLNSALTSNGINQISLSTSDLSLTISSDNTVSISAASMITIPGTYTYTGDDSSGTFKFTLNYDSLGQTASIAQLIGNAFTQNDITYETGSLSAVLGEEESEGGKTSTKIFTK